MEKVIAVKPHSYRNRNIAVGQEYEADPKSARALSLGRVVRYSDREMRPEAPRMLPAPEEFVEPPVKKTPKPRTPRKPKAN